jgi:hypothetical protein
LIVDPIHECRTLRGSPLTVLYYDGVAFSISCAFFL